MYEIKIEILNVGGLLNNSNDTLLATISVERVNLDPYLVSETWAQPFMLVFGKFYLLDDIFQYKRRKYASKKN